MTQTIPYFVPDETFTINKRTKRGKHALNLISDASQNGEYAVSIGKRDQYDDEGALHITLVNDIVVSRIVNYLFTYQPTDPYYRHRPVAFVLVTSGVWSVRDERWSWVKSNEYKFNPETNEVDVTEKSDTYSTLDASLAPLALVQVLVATAEGKLEKARIHQANIASLKASQPLPSAEQYAVEKVQKFVDECSEEFAPSKWPDQHLRNAKTLVVRMLARDIAKHFLAVVGKTTLEQSYDLVSVWRDDRTVDRVIGVDEAFGRAVIRAMRSDTSSDSVTRDLLGEAVKYFSEVVR